MRKTLSVVAVVLSLISVCQPAPLTCDELKKPLVNSPDLSGRWYTIGMSSFSCLLPAIFNAFVWPSIAVDFTAKDTPNTYEGNFKVNMYGSCRTESMLLKNNRVFDLDQDNAKEGYLYKLLKTGCPDCLIVKMDSIATLLLLSRRENVTDAELKEFEAQGDCNGMYKPQVFNTDHDYKDCRPFSDDKDNNTELPGKVYERLKTAYTIPLQCVTESVLYYTRVAFGWVQQKWNNLW